jgi:hypothetical protein
MADAGHGFEVRERRPGAWLGRARRAWPVGPMGPVGIACALGIVALWGACDGAPERPAASAAVAGVGGGGGAGEARWEHRFAPTAALDRMDAEVCFHGRVPPRLEPQTARVREVITGLVRVRGGEVRPLAMGEHGVELAEVAPGDCVRYAVDLARTTAPELLAYRRRASAWRYGEDLVLSPDYYLLRPTGSLAHVALTARFDLPPGVNVLVPWPRLDPAQAGTAGPYRIPSTSFTWRIHGALGRFDIDVVEAAGARLRVAVLGPGWQVERGALLAWLADAANVVAGLYDGFPEAEAQILVLPAPGARVAHGNVAQGGGPSVALMVGTEITAEAMRKDWVAVHELLHLGMPTVENGARWLSEGLATYYEPLLRARAGWITPGEAWEILHDGFQRGSARGSGRTLADESRDMGETHEYWRVYWAGAAIAMIADVTLRGHAGAPTLDEQMRAIRACCLHGTRTWTAEALLDAVATPGAAPDLASVAARHVGKAAFPELGEVYAALGLRFDAQGRLIGTPEELDAAARALRAALIDREGRAGRDGQAERDGRSGRDDRGPSSDARPGSPAAAPAGAAHSGR